MKFNWGTGIFLFLVLFLAGAAVFIVFASRQKVNLVHEDYYKEGVDYTEQMRVDSRSKVYLNSISTQSTDKFFLVYFDDKIAAKIDSGMIHMYRPSDSSKDLRIQIDADDREAFTKGLQLDKQDLLNGRYILKLTWFTDGVKYEIDKPVSVQ